MGLATPVPPGGSRYIERRFYFILIKPDDHLAVDNNHRHAALIGQGDHLITGGLVLTHIVQGKRIIPLRNKLFRLMTMGSGGKGIEFYLCHVDRCLPWI